MRIVTIGKIERIEDRKYRVEMVFPSGNKYEATVTDPFLEDDPIDKDREIRLYWYFEEHLRSPYTDREKAKRAAQSIAEYGETLFKALFKKADVLNEWRGLVSGGESVRVKVDSKDAHFQALHWEALKDPEESKPCCLSGVSFTRTSGKPTPLPKEREDTCLNVLMVTARPRGKDDIEYRTITRPVVETIEKHGMPVKVHLLRPPTFGELHDHLRKNKGVYHMVHLDVHGNVMTHPEYEAFISELKKRRTGVSGRASRGRRRTLTHYNGTKGFVFLEAPEGGADPVPADEIADLLREAQVRVCLLNACRSAMTTWTAEKKEGQWEYSLDASLAMTLLERGVNLVLGMAWSLTVAGATICMPELYAELTEGASPLQALNLARQAMYDTPCRYSGKDLEFELEDWLLPVVWCKGEVEKLLQLREMSPEEKLARAEITKRRMRELEGMKTTGQYGFLGRDVDILEIERLLQIKNILLIKGLGGTGKTTLLGHMAGWWLKTGWVEHVYYFGYDVKPYHAEEILNTVAQGVMPQGDYGILLTTPEVEKKAILLRDFLKPGRGATRVVLILDNMESITGREKAVGSQLVAEEQGKLTAALKVLMDSGIKILLGSRSDEEWLGKETFNKSIYELTGLDRSSRYALAEAILKDISIPAEERGEFERLMEILAGYPLAMEIILPNLGSRGAGELLNILTGAEVDLKGGAVAEAIFKCINISFSLLTQEAQESMLVFAPFTGFLVGLGLEHYLKELHATGEFSSLTRECLEESLKQCEKQGLLKQIFPNGYSIQPVFPFFLGRQVEALFGSEKKEALHDAFCKYMELLANQYNALMESKEANPRQMGFVLFKLDRENLHKALHRVLDREGDFYRLYNVFAFFYHSQPLHEEAIGFMEKVVEKLDRYASKDEGFLLKYSMVVGNLGSYYMGMKKYGKSKKCYKDALSLLQKAGKEKEAATAYHQLGMVAQEERDWKEAKENFNRALEIYQEFNDRYELADTYHHLGMVAQYERDWKEAKENFNRALEIAAEFNDSMQQARTYHHLGIVAQYERDWKEAKENFQKGLKILQEFNDKYNQARFYHHLGIVAQAERDWKEAKENFNRALEIKQEFNDRYELAGTYHHLGMVAQYERDWKEAKENFKRAIEIYQEFNDSHGQARLYLSMGVSAEEEQDHPSALSYYAAALEIFVEYQDEYSIQIVVDNLSILFQTWDPKNAIEEMEAPKEVKEGLFKLWEEVKGEKERRKDLMVNGQ